MKATNDVNTSTILNLWAEWWLLEGLKRGGGLRTRVLLVLREYYHKINTQYICRICFKMRVRISFGNTYYVYIIQVIIVISTTHVYVLKSYVGFSRTI